MDEAIAFRKRLHEVGKAAFVEETIAQDKVTAKKLCTAFGIMPPAFLEGAPDEAYHPLLAIAISQEFSRRQKLPQYNTIDDAVKLLQESKNIIVLTGAGVSIGFKSFVMYLCTNGILRSQRVSVFPIFDPRTLDSTRNWRIWV